MERGVFFSRGCTVPEYNPGGSPGAGSLGMVVHRCRGRVGLPFHSRYSHTALRVSTLHTYCAGTSIPSGQILGAVVNTPFVCSQKLDYFVWSSALFQ